MRSLAIALAIFFQLMSFTESAKCQTFDPTNTPLQAKIDEVREIIRSRQERELRTRHMLEANSLNSPGIDEVDEKIRTRQIANCGQFQPGDLAGNLTREISTGCNFDYISQFCINNENTINNLYKEAEQFNAQAQGIEWGGQGITATMEQAILNIDNKFKAAKQANLRCADLINQSFQGATCLQSFDSAMNTHIDNLSNLCSVKAFDSAISDFKSTMTSVVQNTQEVINSHARSRAREKDFVNLMAPIKRGLEQFKNKDNLSSGL